MKKIYFSPIALLLMVSCKQAADINKARNEILETEKAFEQMASEKGLAEAFYYYADDSAVILRGNDSLIYGREGIKNYYEKKANPKVKLSWKPDFVKVSECGTLGYTYGKYLYAVQDTSGKTLKLTGIFHTVWKKRGHDWRFVWD
jgi:ketosteroid isomerase-like protein